jgi:hypothetical protein
MMTAGSELLPARISCQITIKVNMMMMMQIEKGDRELLTMPDMVNGLLFRPLHADISSFSGGINLFLGIRFRVQGNWRGIDIVVISLGDFKMDAVVSPGVNVMVTIKSRIGIQTSPLAILRRIPEFFRYAGSLKLRQFKEPVGYFFHSKSGSEPTHNGAI